MSARDTTPFLEFVARRAMRKGSRVRNLSGTDAKPAVVSMMINGEARRVWVPGAVVIGAASRLLAPGMLAKLPPKPGKGDRWRLVPVDLIKRLPQPLQKQMREPPPSIGNIPLCRPATDNPLWRALEAVYKQLFELSPIWDVTGAARVELIDNAIDAELKAYKKSTSDVGGSKPKKSDKKFYDLERFTDAGQAYVSTPERERERQEQFDAYEAAKEARREEAEAEYARLVPLLSAYGDQLDAKQKKAWNLICYEPHLSGKEIAERSGASEPTVTRRRKWFAELSKRFFALCEPLDDEGGPVNVSPGTAIDTTLDGLFDTNKPEALEALRAPDVEADVSEHVFNGYARTRKTANAHQRPTRRQYSDSALIQGSEKGDRWTREDQASFEHKKRFKEFDGRPISDEVATAIRELAAKHGLDEQALLKSAVLRLSLDDLLGVSIAAPAEGDK